MSQKVTLGFSEVLQSDGKELDPDFSLFEKVVELVLDQCRIFCGNHLYDGNVLQMKWLVSADEILHWVEMGYFLDLNGLLFISL